MLVCFVRLHTIIELVYINRLHSINVELDEEGNANKLAMDMTPHRMQTTQLSTGQVYY